MKKSTPNRTFSENQKLPGTKLSGNKLIMGNHPPKNNIEDIELIISMFAYSPKKK